MNSNEPTSDYIKDGHQKFNKATGSKNHSYYSKNDRKVPEITSFASLSDLTETSSQYRYRKGSIQGVNDPEKQQPLHEYSDDDEEVYHVKQRHGYFSILFSIAQTLVLICMMWQCGIAPININPMVGPYPDALSYWGGKNTVLIVEDNEYWRLMTPILLHAGVIHLFCNISVQLETGAFFEREWGSFTWLTVYLVSALGSSILSCVSMPNSISVGSSGAVMGLFGAKLSEVNSKALHWVMIHVYGGFTSPLHFFSFEMAHQSCFYIVSKRPIL